MIMLRLLLLLMAAPLLTHAWDFSSEFTTETRVFTQKGAYGNDDQSEISVFIRPELNHSWDDDRKVVSFIPFYRFNTPDEQRSHFDLREASFVGSWALLELRVGVSKVYWGVNESQHLVDIINQTDFVENIDGEEKLGQLMINPTVVSRFGTFDYFLLPHFRERTFSGQTGRFRTPDVVHTDEALYQHSDKEKHIDHAFRYAHYVGPLEFGLAYFNGTDRDPIFKMDNGRLKPYYVQMQHYGLDAQYIYKSWAFKLETILKDRQSYGSYVASTAGFEYTFSNLYKGLDLGLLAEHLYDERGATESFFDNHLFMGGRIALNDVLGTELLAGAIVGLDETTLNSLRLEATRRITNSWKWELEANAILNTNSAHLNHLFSQDDYVKFALSYYL